jgi:hypothetical protein
MPPVDSDIFGPHLQALGDRLDRLHADFGGLREDLRRMLTAFELRTAADDARTALVRDAATAVTGTPWGRALLTVALVRVLFGSAADALLIAMLSRVTGTEIVP